MNVRKATLGLCMLCALAVSAFAAQSALASPETGNTVATCGKNIGNNDWADAHCKTFVGINKGEYGHVEVAVNTPTAITATNITTGTERSTAKLKSVQSGVTLELQATEVSGTGEMENKKEGEGESEFMWAEGTGTLVYEGVTVTAPAGKGCKVAGGKVTTNKLAGTTKNLNQQLKFTPAAGETFAEFTVEGCSIGALNHAYTAKGSVTGNTVGATTSTTHEAVTTANTLTLAGQKAGIEGSITIKGANGNGLALTTKVH